MWLWLLVAWLEETDEPAASLAYGPPAERSQITPVADKDDPFIPMPSHLTTRAEMLEWMTRELPKLTDQAARRMSPLSAHVRSTVGAMREPLHCARPRYRACAHQLLRRLPTGLAHHGGDAVVPISVR